MNISHQVNFILSEVKNLLLLDPKKQLKFQDPSNNRHEVPYFRSWNGDQRLRQHAIIRSARRPTLRSDIYNSAGIKPGELGVCVGTVTNLSDFRASVIRNGAFKLELTRDPALHLRFDENDEMRPTLLILDSRTISMLALLDLTGFMSYVPHSEDAYLTEMSIYLPILTNSLHLTHYSLVDPRHRIISWHPNLRE
jgi:hypothetical protein